MRVCSVCQRPNVINLSSHLIMVHSIDGDERSHHLKKAVLCQTTMSPPVQPLNTKTEKVKLKNIRSRQKPRVTQHLQHSLGKEPTADVKPEPYRSFCFRHKFSLMVVGPSMSGKSYFVKEILEKDHIHYEEPSKY